MHPPSASGLSADAFFSATITIVAVVALEVAAGERLLPTLVLAGWRRLRPCCASCSPAATGACSRP
jgi:hypothetical protein